MILKELQLIINFDHLRTKKYHAFCPNTSGQLRAPTAVNTVCIYVTVMAADNAFFRLQNRCLSGTEQNIGNGNSL